MNGGAKLSHGLDRQTQGLSRLLFPFPDHGVVRTGIMSTDRRKQVANTKFGTICACGYVLAIIRSISSMLYSISSHSESRAGCATTNSSEIVQLYDDLVWRDRCKI